MKLQDRNPLRLARRALLPALLAFQGHAVAQSASVEARGDAVIFKGQINPRSAADFLRLLQDPKIGRLVIDSRGGIVSAALAMAQAIHARQLDVEVPDVCHSSCANYIFPAGRNKTIGHAGAVAWHGNMTHVLYLHQTGQADPKELPIAGVHELAAREAGFFSRIDVDGFVCWFAKIAPYRVEDFYSLSPADMERFGIRNVTVGEAPARVDPQVREVQVDWDTLETIRPVVPLAP